ncbi:MAG: phosphate ABC transporter permease PstA [Defluviitaleaceae bacterium]|nr:phosphate ABC transporter permease PstA [Defluviitaleaceae bacterium]
MSSKRKIINILNHARVYFGIGVSLAILLSILLLIIINGIQSLSFEFVFSLSAPRGFSLMPMIINTFIIVIFALVIALPLGIGAAIYLNEYAKPNSNVVKVVRACIVTLSGIPSIIYGLFGFLFYVIALGWTWSLRAGIFTVSIMILPILIRSTEDALRAIPVSYRMGSYALGAGKFHTIRKVVVPAAINGILASVILSIGRVVGETAALLLTAGTLLDMPQNLSSSGATLSVFMYLITVEHGDMQRAYATALVLMTFVLGLNLLANFIARKLKKV